MLILDNGTQILGGNDESVLSSPRNSRYFLGLTLSFLLLLSPSISGSDSHFRVSGMLDSRHGIPQSWQSPTIKGVSTAIVNFKDIIFFAIFHIETNFEQKILVKILLYSFAIISVCLLTILLNYRTNHF